MSRISGHDDLKPGLDNPAPDAIAVTPDDNTDLSPPARALYIGGDGNVAVMTLAGSTVVFTGALGGSVIPVRCKRVLAAGSGTTATNIVALL